MSSSPWQRWSRWLLALCLLAAGWRTWPRFVAAYDLRAEPGVERLEAAVRRVPDDPGHHFRLGVAYRDLPEALDLARSRIHLERAAALNPYSWRYRRELAQLYELDGRLPEAEAAYLESVRLNPGSADYRWRLAHFYVRAGSLADALPHFRAALTGDPRRRPGALAFLLKSGASRAQVEAAWPMTPEARVELLRLLCERPDVAPAEYNLEQICASQSIQGGEPK